MGEIVQGLAWHMFDRRCQLDGASPDLQARAWQDSGVRQFWLEEAAHAYRYMAARLS